MVQHEGDLASQRAHVNLETLVFRLVGVTSRKGEVGRGEEGGDDGGVVGVFVAVGKLGVEGRHHSDFPAFLGVAREGVGEVDFVVGFLDALVGKSR